VLPEATGDPPHLLEQPSIVARCGGMIEPTGAPSSPASPLTRELVAKRTLDCLFHRLAGQGCQGVGELVGFGIGKGQRHGAAAF
jgi:hypothetical protein